MPTSPLSIKTLCTKIGLERGIILAISETVNQYYHPFDNLKYRNSEKEAWRHIDNPTGSLKLLQTRIQRRILRPYALTTKMPDYLVGGMPGRSIVHNARPHTNKPCVIGMDLTKCFDHINEQMVYDVFFNCLNFGRSAAAVSTKLTTFQGRLPQGSSASSILCALALREMAREIDEYCRAHGLQFTMYVDDITISGAYEKATAAIGPIIDICRKYNMHVNKAKTEIMRSNYPQRVTGHSVNSRVGISNQYIANVRKAIISASRPGYLASNRELFQIWTKIDYIRRHDPNKADRLFEFACSRLESMEGIAMDIPGEEHRSCAGYSQPHEVPMNT